MTQAWTLDPDRCFSVNPAVRKLAREIHSAVRTLPLICPHGHVDPNLLADPEARFGNPAELFITPDHYVFRMLYSQGVDLDSLGIVRADGQVQEKDGRRIWQLFADNFHLFRGTPSGLWISAELSEAFGISSKLNGSNAQEIYEELTERLAEPEFTPRALFRRFGIEVLATTDAATDSLEAHLRLQSDGFRVIPTFRPDRLFDFGSAQWQADLLRLSQLSDVDIGDLDAFLHAISLRREQFRSAGATATDHSKLSSEIRPLPQGLAESLFTKALRAGLSGNEAEQLHGHLLFEMARLSCEDGMVMQLHIGSLRNHNRSVYERFGADRGADIPVRIDWTRGLQPLLNAFGNDPRFRLLLFTLDESTYGRELAPLAGHWPAVRLGPPWWFFDSVRGIERYLDQVVETAGFYNLAGFNDDTRAFVSIPARHDVWRRVTSNWLAVNVVRGLMDEEEATEVAVWLAAGAARSAYRLDQQLPA